MATRQIPWARILAEGVAIVVSILLAFGIQAWWDGRQDRAEEQEMLRGLEVDFAANADRLVQVIGLNEAHEDRLFRLGQIGGDSLSGLPPDSLIQYGRALFATNTFDPRDGTLDGALSSGKLELIRDESLQDRLMDWKRRFGDADEEANRLRSLGEQALLRVSALGGPWVGGPRQDVARAIHPSVIDRMSRLPIPDLRLAVGDSTLSAISGARRYTIVLYLDSLHRMKDEADNMLALIRSNLR